MTPAAQKTCPKICSLIFVALTLAACATQSHEMTRHLLEGNDAAVRSDYSTAVDHYEIALRASPNSIPARRNLGIVQVKVGQYDKARRNLLDILPHYQDDLEVLYFLGEASRGLEDYEVAAGYYEKARLMSGADLRVIKALAWTWHKMRHYEKSLGITEPLLKKNPADLQLRLIVSYNYNRLQKFSQTVDLLLPLEKTGFKVVSRDVVSAESERALLVSALAEAYAGQHSCPKAETLYNDVLKTRPFLSSALVGAAKCDINSGNESRAIQRLEKAMRSNTDAPEPYFLLGRLLAKKEPTKSVFYFRRFLLLSQNNRDLSNEIRATRTAIAEVEKRNPANTSRK